MSAIEFQDLIHFTNYGLKLNFGPIIAVFELSGQFVLQHWQAQPKGLRHFGYFSFQDGNHSYHTIPFNLCSVEVCPEPIQIDEKVYKTVPTAVNLFRNSQLIKDGEQWKVMKLNEL
ncbi:hypothetical protein RIF25_09455 [Thermosynechococcaceae cyanobacterium BACA0444]|uniref:Uncharacterized protein n=1 Tax=Pseudocalidococcus azoricus BACA0444 TaxID=2918990 RepID=A0AAE4FRP0_9CYAN|nr:hypothetical protein [Pseudocalidococcus azoricus]MDS3861034.1 hypothetical protein [Pseudocalidococcus azoricus BACA0444]